MTIISICNHKGGSGKTTCTINLAAALNLVGYKTLAIDLDPQGFMTRMLGIDEPKDERKSVMQLFNPDATWDQQHIEKLESFDFIPSSTALTNLLRKLTKPMDVLWLKEILRQKNEYDFILIDSSSSVTVYTLNALVASDLVIIPVIPEYLPVIGADQTFQTCFLVRSKLNPDMKLPYFLLTQVDARKSIHKKYRQYLLKNYKGQVLKTPIQTNTQLSEESLNGRTIFSVAANSKGTADFANVTDEILKIVKGEANVSELIPEFNPQMWRPIVEI
jgi:chromosome partitioning protein